MNNLITILMLLVFFVSCKKNPNFEHKIIDFSYADSLAGIYQGDITFIIGAPDFTEYNSTLTIEVIDQRTEKECKFFIDYLDEDVYIQVDGEFLTNWKFLNVPETYITDSKFQNDSLLIKEDYYGHLYSFESFIFNGKKQ